jgi:ligand-binding SRPBCC domain-containing protein
MRTYEHKFLVKASIQSVALFHEDTKTLKKLTPPPIFVELHRVEPVEEGSRAEFTMWIGPIPIRWSAIHTDYDPERGFMDTQVSGPFTYWAHRHIFTIVDMQTTEITDEIQAELGVKLIDRLISSFMWLNLPILFAFREWVTRRALEKP